MASCWTKLSSKGRSRRALHGEEELDEDDSFLSVGSETWDYEIADGRQDEFLAALKNSQMAMECIPLDE